MSFFVSEFLWMNKSTPFRKMRTRGPLLLSCWLASIFANFWGTVVEGYIFNGNAVSSSLCVARSGIRLFSTCCVINSSPGEFQMRRNARFRKFLFAQKAVDQQSRFFTGFKLKNRVRQQCTGKDHPLQDGGSSSWDSSADVGRCSSNIFRSNQPNTLMRFIP